MYTNSHLHPVEPTRKPITPQCASVQRRRWIQLRAAQPLNHAHPVAPKASPRASEPAAQPHSAPNQGQRTNDLTPPSKPRRRRWKGRLLAMLALALVAFLAAAFFYGLLTSPSPTNILVIGIDRRPGEGTAVRTDTILLLHADPGNRRLTMLSIPRDLWVSIPGQGEGRINTAHVYGELEAPGSGPALTAETIKYNFGVHIHHYLRLDFDAFRDVIDAAGGIEVDVPAPMIDNAYPTEDYGTMRIEIPAGWQHMDGETALRYARSRHSSSDFDRAARQQQILTALINKLTQPSGWLLLPQVYLAFQKAVETDMDLRDLAILGLAWQRAGENGLDKMVIDRALTTPFRTPQGAAVLLPRWELIQPLVQAQFTP